MRSNMALPEASRSTSSIPLKATNVSSAMPMERRESSMGRGEEEKREVVDERSTDECTEDL
jgi:hypothetical protein